MRALLPLLAVLAAAPRAPAAPAAPLSRALLVLRAACHPPLPAAFDETRLANYEPAHALLHRHRVRVLSYEDTCGAQWKQAVTSSVLAALGAGDAVLSAGCAGAWVCDAVGALRRARGAACATHEARGAAVARLAARLGWQRALLPPAARGSECAAALQQVSLALAATDLAVHRAPLSPQLLLRQPDVVILCASDRRARAARTAGAGGAGGARPLALLLHVDECDVAPAASADATNSPTNLTYDAFKMSNISLVVGNSLFVRNKTKSSSDQSVIDNKSVDMSSPFRLLDSTNISKSTYTVKGHRDKNIIDVDSVRQEQYYPKPASVNEYDATRAAPAPLEHKSQKQWSDAVRSDSAPSLLPPTDAAFFQRMLLLTDRHLDWRSYVNEEAVYDKILESLESESMAENSRFEKITIDFQLYERSNITSWSHAAVLRTTLSRWLDLADDWDTSVELLNASAALGGWGVAPGPGPGPGPAPADVAGTAALSAVAACGALTLGTCTALALRWLGARRRRRRRRRDAVLAPADFTFPVDERRRVGEGMESMLSCWLQQLHEFGGPELERPDLLKQPPGAAPRPTSAPSSTCSVNRVAVDRRIRYKGDVVYVKNLPATAGFELKRKATDVLLVMQNLRHENFNPFIGCLCELRPALVFDHCGRGSLEDVLMADDIKLDWTFRLSLLTDLVKGMRYLHASPLRVHGRLSSRNCVVDSRWVLRVTDYGLPALLRAQGLPHPLRAPRDLLWTAPELLREADGGGRGSQPGDVFSFAIIMQEVIVRGEPYCMLALTPEEIIEKVSRPPPLIRPSVSMGAAPPDAVSVMRQCWSEAPDLRPDFTRLHDVFRHLHRGRKVNIVDSMFEMLEKYSNNLEELIKERTDQLDMEKKKTEQLLNRMLPRSVAERLMLGSRVEPEEFEEVSIYFSDIVGFTALAARSTPVQVVDMLNDLYTSFDATIEQYRVYKVETIGDAYMVVGGLPARSRSHAADVATMALHLLHVAGRFRPRHLPDTPLHLRIGLHSGPVCAAVVGLTMPRYCLFGDTVNTASRMESTGAAWRVQLSAATAQLLAAAGGYHLRERGRVMIKGKGAMHTYWLLGKDGFDRPLPTPPPLQSEEVLFEMEGENESECSSAPGSNTPPTPAARSDPSDTTARLDAGDKRAWQRSGAMSADCSPPRSACAAATACNTRALAPPAPPTKPVPPAPLTPPVNPAPIIDHTAQYSRYRCLGNARRPLRRQWSLERGDALAAAAAATPPGATSAPPSPPEPLALLVAGAPRPLVARYRTRPDRDESLALHDDARPLPL